MIRIEDNKITTHLNWVEIQIKEIKGKMEEHIGCNDVLNLITEVQAVLDSICKLILENHIRECLVEKIQTRDEEIVDELLVTIGKML